MEDGVFGHAGYNALRFKLCDLDNKNGYRI